MLENFGIKVTFYLADSPGSYVNNNNQTFLHLGRETEF